jgi:hypothetical protein
MYGNHKLLVHEQEQQWNSDDDSKDEVDRGEVVVVQHGPQIPHVFSCNGRARSSSSSINSNVDDRSASSVLLLLLLVG